MEKYHIEKMDEIKNIIRDIQVHGANDKNIDAIGNKTYYRNVIALAKGIDIDDFVDIFEGYAFKVQGMFYEKVDIGLNAVLEYYEKITDAFYTLMNDCINNITGRYTRFYKTISDMMKDQDSYYYYRFVDDVCTICNKIIDHRSLENEKGYAELKQSVDVVSKLIDDLFLKESFSNGAKVYNKMQGISSDTTLEQRRLYKQLHASIVILADNLYVFGNSLNENNRRKYEY